VVPIVPGHGGMVDRLGTVWCFAAPFAYLTLIIFSMFIKEGGKKMILQPLLIVCSIISIAIYFVDITGLKFGTSNNFHCLSSF